MTLREARTILTEMQKWRRGEHPYDGDTPKTHRKQPYSPEEYGKAIDVGIESINARLEQSHCKV